jgi:hypothetical protein
MAKPVIPQTEPCCFVSREIATDPEVYRGFKTDPREFSDLVRTLTEVFESERIPYYIVNLGDEITWIPEKRRLFKECGLLKRLDKETGIPHSLGWVKTIAFGFGDNGSTRYILAATIDGTKADPREIRAAFGLQREGYQTLAFSRINNDLMTRLTGSRIGGVVPLVPLPNLNEQLAGIYFTRALMQDAERQGEDLRVLHEIPLTPSITMLANARSVYQALSGMHPNIRAFQAAAESEIEVADDGWRIRKAGANDGARYCFGGTIAKYRDAIYVLKNPSQRDGCHAVLLNAKPQIARTTETFACEMSPGEAERESHGWVDMRREYSGGRMVERAYLPVTHSQLLALAKKAGKIV